MVLIHDQYIQDLAAILRSNPQYYIISINVPYGPSNRIIGEIDVLAIGHDFFDLFEVKGSCDPSNMRKAISQLNIARHILGNNGDDFIYTPKRGIQSLEDVTRYLSRKKSWREGRKR